jgi:hypothetical protein
MSPGTATPRKAEFAFGCLFSSNLRCDIGLNAAQFGQSVQHRPVVISVFSLITVLRMHTEAEYLGVNA